MVEKILLDTDIGSDIDDAVCLAYLLMQPDCELLGITTVTGQSDERAKMASAICKIANKDIPIIPGANDPLIIEQIQPTAPQAVRVKNWPHQSSFPKTNPIRFMAETILDHPGEVTLLTIGPLTNAALLFKVYPEVIPALKRLVMMGGTFSDHPDNPDDVDWNVMLDPHAAEIVYASRVENHISVGLDITCQVRLNQEQVKTKFDHPLLESIMDFAEVWFHMTDTMYFHDPLAALSIFDPEVCQFNSGLAQINLDLAKGELGLMTFDPNASEKPHCVATQVDNERFFQSFFSVFD